MDLTGDGRGVPAGAAMHDPREAAAAPVSPWGGSVAPGFEPVLKAFVAGLDDLGAGGGSFAAYHRGREVVHLWGGWARPGQPWGEDTLAVVFSSSKGLATLCLQMVHARGGIDVDAHVADVWPEFGAASKERVRVRHVLAHTSGVLAPHDAASFLSWQGSGWGDSERIETGLATTSASVPIGSTFAYHAFSFGWLLDALLRRTSGASVGRFLESEITRPLGLDLRIGTPAAVQPRVAQVVPESGIDLAPDIAAAASRSRELGRDPTSLQGRAFLALAGGDLLDNLVAFNRPALLAPEISAVNATATARSLARLYAVLASGGEFEGVRLVPGPVIEQFRRLQICAPNAVEMEADPPPRTVELHRRMLGYHGSSRPYESAGRLGPSPTAFGHDGLGGQLAFADPERSIAAAFVRSQMTSRSRYSADLLDRLYDCAGSV